MKQQLELNSQHIAIWVGDMSDEEELEEYLDEVFPDEFGFKIDCHGQGPEYDFGERKEIGDLLTGFSSDAVFVKKATEVAQGMGIKKASAALVFHWVKYDESLKNPSSSVSKFKFICNVEIPTR